MIAASEPQEYVPSGRQQALQHPGPLEQPTDKRNIETDDFLLTKLEEVSLIETKPIEWWILRKTPSITDGDQQYKTSDSKLCANYNKSRFSDIFDDSCKSVDDSVCSKGKTALETSARLGKLQSESDSRGNDSKSSEGFKAQAQHRKNTEVFNTKLDPFYMEDELYVKGNTVIWSRGLVNNGDNLDNGRKTLCCYTTPSPIKNALWSTFYCERPTYNKNLLDMLSKIHQPCGTPVPSICILEDEYIRVFSPKGEDFVISVPFQVGKIWNTRFGIIIEKDHKAVSKDTFCENQSTLYSLAYPLDDICPVAISQATHLNYFNNPNATVVFTSDYPSICVVYDSITKQHSVYRIRKVKPNEVDLGDKAFSSCHSTNTSSHKLKSRLSMWDNVMGSNNLQLPSPANPKPPGLGRDGHLQQSRSHSSMATISRCQSPALSSSGSCWLQQASRMNISYQRGEKVNAMTNKSFFDCSRSMSHLRSAPTICMDYLWTDTFSIQEGAIAGPASKVFLSDDLVGQWYLCYILLSRFQLSIVKVDFSRADVSFGVLTSISAKDAVSIPHLHMLAILEHNGNVTLYSGLTMVGKVHIGGTLAQYTPSPYVRRNLPQFNSPFPRRSSLLPNKNPIDPKFDEHLLSPVLPNVVKPSTILQLNTPLEYDANKVVLSTLTDAIENRMTLKYSDGTCYRITLPQLATSTLVENSLNVMRHCLPRDAALTFLSRWYSTRNVLGSRDISQEQEWGLFTQLLCELLGYDEEQHDKSKDPSFTPCNVKRPKHATKSSDEDWTFMVNSSHNILNHNLEKLLKLKLSTKHSKQTHQTQVSINSKSILFPYIRKIHYTMHLLYEDLKLNTLRASDLVPLMKFLNKLASDLGLWEYSLHYWKDFPEFGHVKYGENIPEADLKHALHHGLDDKPVCVMKHIYRLIKGQCVVPYPYLSSVNDRSRVIVQLCGILGTKMTADEILLDGFVKDMIPNAADETLNKSVVMDGSQLQQIVLLMVEMKITLSYLDTLPMGVYLFFYNALWCCRENPPSNWPVEAYYLIWREDLASQVEKNEKEKSRVEKFGMYSKSQLQESVPSIKHDSEQLDGMEDIDNSIMKLRFSEDVRVMEARKMLQSSKPVPVVVVQRPDVSDHDLIEEEEKHLYAICTRTMALPVGRGMFTLRTATPVITELFPTPQLCLTGKSTNKGTSVELSHIDTPANMNFWPLFHNGVASGLRITPDANNIDDTWIVFNQPSKIGGDLYTEHGGFLMALGLNGHLKNLAVISTYEYLSKQQEMSIGVLLGLSADFRGTCNMPLTKALSIHVEALLPPTSMELDVSQNVQVAALLGIGLVYQRTAHRHMTEALLSEIGRPPGPEMENSVDRESYSLAAGLALGLVTLKHGGHPAGLSDLNVPDMLHYYMVGGNKRPLTGSQKDKYKVPSFQIREGSSVNLDVTAPGATLALGLMYLGTDNKAVADWMAPPETQYLLDFVRPDFLMLRTLSRSLILWNDIEPSKDWVQGQVPSTILPYCLVKPSPLMDVDYEAMNQAYCNIVAGACFGLGLKFAGSADPDAFETLLYYCHMFTSLTVKSIAELAGKPTIETCLNVLLLSISMVMAGTGNLEIMRLVRYLRRRVGVSTSAVVTYGSHLAIHMALGLLFLGGGRYTLSNSPQSVAALICAFYPKFPTHSNDNRYHLQAFRHLYVLAVEPRLLIPKDVNLKKSCYANLSVVKLDGSKINIKGPGLLPDVNDLIKVAVEDDRYWPVVFERGRNWDLLLNILSTTGYIEVKQRAGCLSYIDDKFGYQSQLARTLTQSEIVPWDPSPSGIISFSSDELVKHFCDHYLTPETDAVSRLELRLRQMLTKVTYDAVAKDKLIVILVFTSLIKCVREMETSASSLSLWQVKIALEQVLLKPFCNLLSKEVILAIKQEIASVLDVWEEQLAEKLKTYLVGGDLNMSVDLARKLAGYVTFYDIPYGCNSVLSTSCNFFEIAHSLPEYCSFESVNKVMKICRV